MLADDLSDPLTPGTDRIRIHRLPTIGEIFGTGCDVLRGGTVNNADMVYLPNPDGNGMIALYYSNFTQFGSTGNILLDTGEGGLLQSFFSSGDVSLAGIASLYRRRAQQAR